MAMVVPGQSFANRIPAPEHGEENGGDGELVHVDYSDKRILPHFDSVTGERRPDVAEPVAEEL